MFFQHKHPYRVTVHLDGRHPYLRSNELDYHTRDVVMVIPARSFNHAARKALICARSIPNWWAASVTNISSEFEEKN